jgi:GT2 family glycosyltransferase
LPVNPPPATLREALRRSNAYDDHVTAFESRTGLGWHDLTPASAGGGSLSVVIPARNMNYSLPTVLDALAAQEIAEAPEVIVVDDGSGDGTADAARLHPLRPVVVRMPRRRGPSTARNVGAFLASGDTVVFADADMLLPPHGLADIAARACDGLILVGFRHNIAWQPTSGGRAARPPWPADLEADHRVRWRALAGQRLPYTEIIPQAPIQASPLRATDGFRQLGYGRSFHDWDLPRVVVSALMAVPRRALADVGGFSSRFDETGWGCEDTYVGAALIGAGLMVVPLQQLVGYHVNPPDEARSWQAKLATWPATIALYRQMLEEPPPAGRAGAFASAAEAALADCEVTR